MRQFEIKREQKSLWKQQNDNGDLISDDNDRAKGEIRPNDPIQLN